jgi:putative tricarboxylic transport membrane protein
MAQRNFFSLIVMLVSCLMAVLMDVFGISSLPFLMAFILAPQVESNLRLGLSADKNGLAMFFTRPISCVFIVAGTLVLIYGFISPLLKKGKKSKNDEARDKASKIND